MYCQCCDQVCMPMPQFFSYRRKDGDEHRLSCMDYIKKVGNAASHSLCLGAEYIATGTRRAFARGAFTRTELSSYSKIIAISLAFFLLIALAGAASAAQPRNGPSSQLKQNSAQALRENAIPITPESYQKQRGICDRNGCDLADSQAPLVPRTHADSLKEWLSAPITRDRLAKKVAVTERSKRNLLLNLLSEMRQERGAHEFYVDFVLQHPGLTFAVRPLAEGTEAETIFAHNQIVISDRLMHAARQKIKNKLYHELWHMYYFYVNANYSDPRMFSPSEIRQFIIPYLNASEKAFGNIIEQGKRRLSSAVIPQSQIDLFKNYEPREFMMHVSLSQFQNLKPAIETFLKKNSLAPITFTINNQELPLYALNYSIEGQKVALICFSTNHLQA